MGLRVEVSGDSRERGLFRSGLGRGFFICSFVSKKLPSLCSDDSSLGPREPLTLSARVTAQKVRMC